MDYREWLQRKVKTLEDDIRNSPVFDDSQPSTHDQLRELRESVVLHTYLKQQLRRDRKINLEDRDTLEYVLVPVPLSAFRPE